MPNYVTNILTFGSDETDRAAFQRMLDMVREQNQPRGSIDFNKIIPMPESIRQSRGMVRDGKPVVIQWCQDHWGSKWGAMDCCPLDQSDDTAYFYTAWTDVTPVITALSKMCPEQTVRYQWAENENIGHNVGELTIQNGEILTSHLPDDETRDAYEMAFQILNADPADCDLYLAADESTYEYREQPPLKNHDGSHHGQAR